LVESMAAAASGCMNDDPHPSSQNERAARFVRHCARRTRAWSLNEVVAYSQFANDWVAQMQHSGAAEEALVCPGVKRADQERALEQREKSQPTLTWQQTRATELRR
jgi:hypothetical protein